MKVWENGLRRARRVVLEFEGDALSSGVSTVEAVRIANDFFLVDANGICAQGTEAATGIANLTAGDIVAGITYAEATGFQGEVNGYHSYQYLFPREAVVISVFRDTPGEVVVNGGEVWVAPELNVVTRMGIQMTIHRAKILFGDILVTGILDYRYNLVEVSSSDADAPNVTVPNGC